MAIASAEAMSNLASPKTSLTARARNPTPGKNRRHLDNLVEIKRILRENLLMLGRTLPREQERIDQHGGCTGCPSIANCLAESLRVTGESSWPLSGLCHDSILFLTAGHVGGRNMLMHRLMLLRHAKSDWPAGVDDHERPLAIRGRRTSPLMGMYMAEKGLVPDLAIVSTARRARETWKLIRPAFKHDISRRKEPCIYDASAKAILDVVRATAPDVEALLLVGHNPGLQDLALMLIGKGGSPYLSQLHRKFPTAGLVVIDFDINLWGDISEGLGRLERFETPKSIGPLANVR